MLLSGRSAITVAGAYPHCPVNVVAVGLRVQSWSRCIPGAEDLAFATLSKLRGSRMLRQ